MKPLATLATKKTPFFFFTNFEGVIQECYPLDQLEANNIFFDFTNTLTKHSLVLHPTPSNFATYQQKIKRIKEAIKNGETYVLNYTQSTPVSTQHSLSTIFKKANAPFKLLYKNKFVCFSPEPFVTIKGNTIQTFPMKGTIDASVPNAKAIILENEKEKAEHTMIVDLLRNDLSMVASKVKVTNFRYTQTIQAGAKKLIQVSSCIEGILPKNWKHSLDDILATLLPAGSISGAPKKSTLKHIKAIETYDRGCFTGIMGYFDGTTLNTAVMIRFIENTDRGLMYKSGGGITIDSDAKAEYQEMLDKIYIP